MQAYNNTPLTFYFRETSAPPRESGNTVSLVRSSSGEFSQIRPYEAGESSIRIDSKRSRFESNHIVVREYVIEKEFHVAIIISLDPILRYGTEKYSKYDSIETILRILFTSIRAHEHTGSISLIAHDSLLKFTIPDSEIELQDFLKTLREWLFTAEKLPTTEMMQKCFQDVYTGVREGGVIYLGDILPEMLLNTYAQKHHIQTVAFEIVHEDEILDGVLGDVCRREYGVYGLCISPHNIWLLLQNAFRIW